MRDEVLQYVQRQLALASNRLRHYVYDDTGSTYPNRFFKVLLDRYVNEFTKSGSSTRWLLIPGLRGTGKTTLLVQTASELMKVTNFNTFYFSLDEATEIIAASLFEVLEAYETILGSSFEKLETPTFIFIDEIQSDPNWPNILKTIYDRTDKIMLICSGSSALLLQASSDVFGRRAVVETLYPLSFLEFEKLKNGVYPIKGLKQSITSVLYENHNPKEIFEIFKENLPKVHQYWAKVDRLDWRQYLRIGGFPFTLSMNNEYAVHSAVMGTIDKIISNDVPQINNFKLSTLRRCKQLLTLLAENECISNKKLAETTGLSHDVIAELLYALALAGVIITFPPQGSAVAAARKASKYLFMTPTIRSAIFNVAGSKSTENTREGKLLEDVVALHLYRELQRVGTDALRYDPSEGGADFIVNTNNVRVAIEVGKGKKSIKQVKSTVDNFKCDYGLVIHQGQLEFFEEQRVISLPWDFFALL